MDTHRLDGERPAPGRGAPWCAGSRVAAGTDGVSTRCARPPRCSGPADDTPPAPRLGWQLWALRPGLDGASRPSTTLTRRRPTAGFRDGAPDRNRWGRQSRPSRLRRRGSPGSGSCAGILKDCNIPAVAHGFRSTFRDWAAEETDQSARGHRGRARPRRRQQGRGGVRTAGPVRAAAAPHGRLGSLPCRRAPEGAGAHRADRTTPCRAGVGHGDRDAFHRDRVVVPGAPARPLLTPCQVERLACTHSRPIRPRSGSTATRSERRLRRRGGRRPRPDLGLRSGLHPAAVKSDGHGMGGEPLPLRRRTRPA